MVPPVPVESAAGPCGGHGAPLPEPHRAAAGVILVGLSDHAAWYQATRTIKIVARCFAARSRWQ
jgi:hypothetical protein